MNLPPVIDPNDLAQAGWGVVFPSDINVGVRNALTPLLALRRSQCGDLFRELHHRPGETFSRFLGRHGVSPGAADPKLLPYYLLIVGSPDRIPFQFQQQLDLGYAVGRLHFDTAEEYDRYALGIIDAEQGRLLQQRRLAVVAPRFAGDAHTGLMAGELIEPLRREAFAESWPARMCVGNQATKAAVLDLFREFESPALLVTATHSVVARSEEPRARAVLGAPICQDWPGIGTDIPLAAGQFLSGDDVTDTVQVRGMMALLWGSFTAGCLDGGSADPTPSPTPTASGPPFVSALAQRLLAGGALAVIGSIDRVLGFSFANPTQSKSVQTQAIIRALRGLMGGQRVGHAAQAFDEAYAASAVELGETLEKLRFGSEIPPADLAALWATTTDLRNIAVIGDPAVRLPAASRDPTHDR